MTKPLKPCPDCGADVGQPHAEGCDVAVCLATGAQRLQCEMGIDDVIQLLGMSGVSAAALADVGVPDPAVDGHDCGHDVWTGHWPGDDDCVRLGFWCYWGPPWIRCAPSHPEATPDLNRLRTDCRWDPVLHRWELSA